VARVITRIEKHLQWLGVSGLLLLNFAIANVYGHIGQLAGSPGDAFVQMINVDRVINYIWRLVAIVVPLSFCLRNRYWVAGWVFACTKRMAIFGLKVQIIFICVVLLKLISF